MLFSTSRKEVIGNCTLYLGNCLEVMPTLPEKSADMVMCDLPYGTTQNKWDAVIAFGPLWREYVRVCSGAVVLTATQPFSSALVMSNPMNFKYEWIWRKSRVTGVLNAKHQPLRQHESVLVFQASKTTYNAQGLVSCAKKTATGRSKTSDKSSNNYGAISQTDTGTYTQTQTGWPRSVLDVASEGKTDHPTQKPVALMEYMIRTYTNERQTVLDNCMGSGTTGVACVRSGRKFIGIEQDEKYFDIACGRIERAAAERSRVLL